MSEASSRSRAVYFDGAVGFCLFAVVVALNCFDTKPTDKAAPTPGLSKPKSILEPSDDTTPLPRETPQSTPAEVPPTSVAQNLSPTMPETSPSAPPANTAPEVEAKPAEPADVPETAPKPKFRVADPEPKAVVAALVEQPHLNRFGNPEGNEFGLARPREFSGARLLVWTAEPQAKEGVFTADNPLWAALRDKGFDVELSYGAFPRRLLDQVDQVWIFAGQLPGLDRADDDAIMAFVNAGKGLYLIAENAPFFVDVSRLASRMFGTDVSGNYQGEHILAVKGRGVTRDDFQRSGGKLPSRQGDQEGGRRLEQMINNATHYVDDHPLLTDVNFIYEGITISHIRATPRLQIVLTASDNQILAAVSRDAWRVVVDCGYTRYMYPEDGNDRFVTETAGTLRYAENIAAYLMYKDDKRSDGKKWREKRQTLSKYRNADRSAILAGLKHLDPMDRWAAIVESQRQKLDFADEFIELLKDASFDVYMAARLALVQLADGLDYGPAPDGTDKDLAESTRLWQRWRVSQKYSTLITTAHLENVAKALQSANFEERWAAIMAIAERKLLLIDEVCERLADENESVRIEALQALRHLPNANDLGPPLGASAEAIADAVREWKSWWKQEREKLASRMIMSAKSFSAKDPAACLRNLEQIVKIHPETAAAAESRRLLESLSKYQVDGGAAFRNAGRSAILEAMKDSNASERWAAVAAAAIKRLDIVDPLIESLSDPDADVRAAGRQALVQLAAGFDAGPVLDADENGRAIAIAKWKRWHATKKFPAVMAQTNVDAMLKSLTSGDAEERWAAVIAVQNRKLMLIDALSDRLSDADDRVRNEAIKTLQQLCPSKDFGPPPNASSEEVAAAAEKWKTWWKQEQEDAAAQMLKLAKGLADSNRDAYRRRLKEIIKEYPKSESAQKAQQLLNEPPPK